MYKSDLPTYAEAIETALKEVDGPVAVSTLIDRILEIRPSSAKNPVSSVRSKLRDNHRGTNLAFLDKETIVPLRVAAPGIRFRIPLSRLEVNHGAFMFQPSFDGWMGRSRDPEILEFVDENGKKLPTKVVTIKQKASNIFGDSEIPYPAFDLSDWFRAHSARRNDSILVTFESWDPRRFRLELEPEKEYRRHRREIAEKNQELADILFDMLESSYHEQIYSRQTIPAAYLRLADPRGYPGDHWMSIVDRDPRMKNAYIGGITYPEKNNMLESMLMDGKPQVAKQASNSKQRNQIYNFKVALKYRKSLWRLIEIQGKQTLGDFDGILREAFGHDRSDHLSGFWKLVRRGQSKRVRQIDLGDVNPFEEGSGANLKIAGLELKVGDKLRYVYDFGDWIEHEITLEKIDPPQIRVEYPRVSGQNKPRHKYCEHCKAEGRKTVATHFCIWCSNEEQREILICEDCLYKHHEDHYVDEVIY